MFTKKIEAALNQQVAMEAAASQKYLAMACWCDNAALSGCAEFLFAHSEEERMHMLKLVHYINEVGGKAIIPAVAQPTLEFENIIQLFETAFANEVKVSRSIDNIVDIAEQEKDKQTVSFLNWYLDEQQEEEALYRTLLDRVKLIGLEGRGLYFIDNEVALIAKKKASAEAAE